MSDIVKGYTPGPWKVFICDDGGRWTGWPLSISAANVLNSNGDPRTVVRTGGQYPYEWDHGTSQDEAVANALLIAAAPDMAAEIEKLRTDYNTAREAHDRRAAEVIALRAALREAADELDAYYRAEYPGDHPYSQRKLAEAIAANPARAALEGEGK